MSIKPFGMKCLTFITTDDCTARCAHCVMCCTPGAKHYLTYEKMVKSIDEAHEKYGLKLVVFTGGEPTLLKNDLLKTIYHCNRLGILTRIVTNAHWAVTYDRAREILSVLRQAGLGEVNFSMDDYHAPYVPIEYVRNAWMACKGLGFQSVVIANSHSENPEIDPKFIQEYLGEEISVRDPDMRKGQRGPNEKRDADGTLYIISEGRLQKNGRAAEEIVDEDFIQYEDQDKLGGICELICAQPSISFTNQVWTCCGLENDHNDILNLGSADNESVVDIIERASDSVILNAIRYIGPYNLVRYVQRKNPELKFKDNYHSVCEVCAELTGNPEAIKVLRANYMELYHAITEREKQIEGEQKKA